jgi:3'-phosphoadenosine 5'-phosphosulfate sulfotransferase (PAPS reductase)/FAD synthetase
MPSLGYKTQIDGTRIAEHDRSNGRAVDVVIDGKQVSRKELPLYLENGLFGLNFVYPIYDWSDAEVWAAIAHYDIPFSEEYLYG